MLDAKVIAEIRELESKATPAPWDYDRDTWWENTQGEQEKEGNLIVYPKNDEDLIIAEVNDQFDKEQGKANSMLFTTVRNALPALLDAVEACESWRNAYNHACRERDRYDQNEREITEEAAALMQVCQVLADENERLQADLAAKDAELESLYSLVDGYLATLKKRDADLAASRKREKKLQEALRRGCTSLRNLGWSMIADGLIKLAGIDDKQSLAGQKGAVNDGSARADM